jgi:hypothetical protein
MRKDTGGIEMARPPKKGIDYSGWSVTIFDNDTKIDKLLDAHGWCGFGIYFYLCQRAYGSEGYFYKWCYDDCASTSRKMGGGISAGTVKETVDYCLQIGLFDKGLFDRWGVLTSKGIQRRYWEVVKVRDVRTVISDYWLLQDDECKGLLKAPLNDSFDIGNEGFPTGNSSFDTGNGGFAPIKKSKVNKKNNTLVHSEKMHDTETLNAFWESVWKLYPIKKGKGQVSKTKKKVLYRIGYEHIKRCVDRFVTDMESEGRDRKYWMHGSTFFNSGYVDYLDDNYSPTQKVSRAKPTGFSNFQQRDYDFDELEKRLLESQEGST